MKKGEYLNKLLNSDKSILTSKDIAMIWQDTDKNTFKVRLNYYLKKGDLFKIRRGIYSKNKNYDRFELATRIFTPSYVSFETVLVKEGLIFQYYERVDVATYLTRELKIEDNIFLFRKIKDNVLTNSSGVNIINHTSIATRERAFLDTLYIDGNYYFDNLRSLDWDKVFKLLPIYENESMSKKVKELYDIKYT
ncbi:MAG: hypothetical protein ACD_26C00034G0025 [uncultured bacterium]|nr:MAG: hypothetical protein ACD_26C00034G0025 [uncultured bacterium]